MNSKEPSNSSLHLPLTDEQLECILGRPQYKLNVGQFAKEFIEKKVLITGAAGTIGAAIASIIAKFDLKELILLDNSETPLYNLQQDLRNISISVRYVIADITNLDRLHDVFENYKPDIIFHAAAYKHVPLMEQYPKEAFRVNVLGTKYLADLSIKFEIEKFILISSDKAVNPANVMGATKRLAELYTNAISLENSTIFISTRFSNILESNGSVIPTFKRQLIENTSLRVTDKAIKRKFMTKSEASNFIIQISSHSINGGIYVFKIGESIPISDLARRLLKSYNLNENKIIYTQIRPGEKIEEEFFNQDEFLKEMKIGNIWEVKMKVEYDYIKIEEQINKLCTVFRTLDNISLVKKMKKIVPEYVSVNSVYNNLDHIN